MLPALEGVEFSETIGDLLSAYLEFQSKVGLVPSNRENVYLKSRYADLGAHIEASRQLLAEAKLCLLQIPEYGDGKVTLKTILFHAPSGEYVSFVMTFPSPTDSPQAVGSLLTYGRRYARQTILGMAPIDGEDDDGEAAEARNGRKKQQPPPSSKKESMPPPHQFDLTDKNDIQILGRAAACRSVGEFMTFFEQVRKFMSSEADGERWAELCPKLAETYKALAAQKIIYPADQANQVIKAQLDKIELWQQSKEAFQGEEVEGSQVGV